MEQSDVRALLPSFVLKSSSTSQFWQWIIDETSSRKERRNIIWSGFLPLIEHFEKLDSSPSDTTADEAFQLFGESEVNAIWEKALERRNSDAEGAITSARTLLETVCKHILDSEGVEHSENTSLQGLWVAVSELMELSPHHHEEEVFKVILGNCQAVVNGLGAVRNKVGDAHGRGRRPVKPSARHAELTVNLSGSMASFLIKTWANKNSVNTGETS